MKTPAIRAQIGDWVYYTTTLSFKEINDYVVRAGSEITTSDAMKEALQRGLSPSRLKPLAQYIIGQPERFFNALTLAVYDNYPTWEELSIEIDGQTIETIGLLSFPGPHKIIPVDGQHRVEGIKLALQENPGLASERIAVILIGHKDDVSGKKRTRRLFTTLNRYAKPTTLAESIALDEDDAAAIITRNMLEDFDLTSGRRVALIRGKAMPRANVEAFTSLVTLYQCNSVLLQDYFSNFNFGNNLAPKNLKELIKFRPSDEFLNGFEIYARNFWNEFKTKTASIISYLQTTSNPAARFRNSSGGSLIFRPVGLLPLVKTAVWIHKNRSQDYAQIFERFNLTELNLQLTPWSHLLWNENESTMKSGVSQTTMTLMLRFLFDESFLDNGEKQKLAKAYADAIGFEGENPLQVLDFNRGNNR